MNVCQQRGREVESLRRQSIRRLRTSRAFAHALVHQPLDAVELNGSHDGADVNGFVERRADAQVLHARTNLSNESLRDALLHQQARTGAADLALIEPDAVDETFDSRV